MLTPTLIKWSPDWVSSDLHISHKNIARYVGRPWPDVDDMNAALVTRWNSVVAPDDRVLLLGDLCMGNIEESLEIFSTLNGQKAGVPGNHDRYHPQFDDHARWEKRYEAAGLEILPPLIRVPIANQLVLACHYPPEGESRKAREDRNVDWRPPGKDDGTPLLHGHVHDRWLQRGGLLNVGLDTWNFMPASAAQIEALILTPVRRDAPRRIPEA